METMLKQTERIYREMVRSLDWQILLGELSVFGYSFEFSWLRSPTHSKTLPGNQIKLFVQMFSILQNETQLCWFGGKTEQNGGFICFYKPLGHSTW